MTGGVVAAIVLSLLMAIGYPLFLFWAIWVLFHAVLSNPPGVVASADEVVERHVEEVGEGDCL